MRKKEVSKTSKFLKGFSKIKVGTICKKLGYDPTNIQNGRSTEEKEKEVFKSLIKEIASLMSEVVEDEEREDSL